MPECSVQINVIEEDAPEPKKSTSILKTPDAKLSGRFQIKGSQLKPSSSTGLKRSVSFNSVVLAADVRKSKIFRPQSVLSNFSEWIRQFKIWGQKGGQEKQYRQQAWIQSYCTSACKKIKCWSDKETTNSAECLPSCWIIHRHTSTIWLILTTWFWRHQLVSPISYPHGRLFCYLAWSFNCANQLLWCIPGNNLPPKTMPPKLVC